MPASKTPAAPPPETSPETGPETTRETLPGPAPFNVLAVVQRGRLEYEALILAASFRAAHPDPATAPRLILAEPQPGPRWSDDPRITPQVRAALERLGAEIRPFDNRDFGHSWPYGNKIEALEALPEGEPFLFLDTDTLILGPLTDLPFDFTRPAASMRREGTWPDPPLYGPGYGAIWKSLYDRFGLDFAGTLDESQPDEYWRRYLYFNAGWFFHADPRAFGRRFRDYAVAIRDDPGEALASQTLDPWLDQVALPLVIRSFGGGRPGPDLSGLDGDRTCHYRTLPLLYAREGDAVVACLEEVTAPNPVKRLLKEWEPAKRLIYQGRGARVRALFDRRDLPRREAVIRNRIKAEGLWFR
ncbi:glycosyltransferase family protein [Frigidibacter oleivorans]|uniref:hypothetical protein n=1 Tax=Frigidibacter oleivorans TaxID=2487129 RepID=UPI001F1F9F82|nr:hypothetical protein [Frigidibacter oleivorans]